MAETDRLQAMLGALEGATVKGRVYEFSDAWEVTLHAGHNGAPLSIAHAVRVTLGESFATVETSKGHRYVVVAEDLYAVAQVPSSSRDSGRRAGF